MADDFLARWPQTQTDETRKARSAARKAIWDEKFISAIAAAIRRQYEDPETRKGMTDVAVTLLNPLRDITRIVACVYGRGAWRFLADSTDEEEIALDDLYDEGDLQSQMLAVNQLAFCLGPIIVVPRVSKRGVLVRDLVYPHQADVHCYPGEAGAQPRAVRWRVWGSEVAWIEVDEVAWRYYDEAGRAVKGPEGFHVVEHKCTDHVGRAACPATVFRLDDVGDPDWWSSAANDRLEIGTIEAGVKYARWKWLRGFADSKRLHASMESMAAIPEGQSMSSPTDAIKTFGGDRTKLTLLDLEIDPENHWLEIAKIVATLEVAYGLDAGTVRYADRPAAEVYLSNDRRNALVSRQKPPLLRAERRLATVTASLLKPHKHRLAGVLPGAAEMWDRHVVEIPEHVAAEDPVQRREEVEWLKTNGIMSRVDIGRMYWSGLTRRQIIERIERNREENARVDAGLPGTDTPADMGKTPAQEAGEDGGRPQESEEGPGDEE